MTDRALTRYLAEVHDSDRWRGFRHRPDDIVVSTPPKCGTTWTQMICALLILQQPDFDTPLARLSPWLDMRSQARREVVAALESQRHRRFIKTHTPLDGLPYEPSVTYICVGRDPRDVAISLDAHRANMDFERFRAARVEAAAIDDVELELTTRRPARPGSGASGQWRSLLDEDDLRAYERRVAALVAPDLAAWAHGTAGLGGSTGAVRRASRPSGR